MSDSLLERWFAAGDAGDLGSFGDFLHPDVVVHAPMGLSRRARRPRKKCGGTRSGRCPISVTISRK